MTSRAEVEAFREGWELERKPTAAIPWTDHINSIPITNLRSWQKSIGNICGVFGNIIEFNQYTFNQITCSKEPQSYDNEVNVPSDLCSLLWTPEPKPIINNALVNGAVVVKAESEYLPEWYNDLEAWAF